MTDVLAVTVVAAVAVSNGTVDSPLDQILSVVADTLLHQDTLHSVADQHAVDQDVVAVANRVVTAKLSV